MADKKQNTNTDIEKAMEAKLAEMLAMAQKKADEILAEAEAKAEEIIKSRVSSATYEKVEDEAIKEMNAKMEEYVDFKAFKDSGKYKDDIFVAVNGESCLIKRGVQTKIKRKFLEALLNSAEQDEYASAYSEGLQDEFESRRKAME